MEPDEICAALDELGIDHFKDSCNPDFTIHITKTGDLIDRCMTESNWEFISLDRSAFIELNDIHMLKTVMMHRMGGHRGI